MQRKVNNRTIANPKHDNLPESKCLPRRWCSPQLTESRGETVAYLPPEGTAIKLDFSSENRQEYERIFGPSIVAGFAMGCDMEAIDMING